MLRAPAGLIGKSAECGLQYAQRPPIIYIPEKHGAVSLYFYASKCHLFMHKSSIIMTNYNDMLLVG